MPPKKKRKLNIQPGIARGYLQENFSTLPESKAHLKNGHVLYLYTSCDKSRAETERQLRSHFSLLDDEGYSPETVNSTVKTLVNKTLLKFKRLSNEKEFEVFSNICDTIFQLPNRDVSLIEDDIQPSDAPEVRPMQSTCNMPSPVSTRTSNEKNTPRKQKMKRRIEFLSASKTKSEKRYKSKIAELKTKLKTPKRIINQTIQRKTEQIEKKNRQIQELKRKLHGNVIAQQLEQTKIELFKLKKAHKKLCFSNKRKSKKNVPLQKFRRLQKKLKDTEHYVRQLELDNIVLKEKIETLETTGSRFKTKVDKKTFSSSTRMHVFDCIVNKTPTANIPILMDQFFRRSAINVESVPQRSSVELMARELGALAELQTAEMILATKDVTFGFDATTQEEVHVNSIHFTSKTECLAAAVDELPGGKAEDYAQHICDTIDSLTQTYVYFREANYQDTRKQMIGNITNTLTDRCAANHAAIRIVNSEWGKSLNELNCHLHPLDTISTTVRSTLKKLEESRGTVFGKDCIAGNIILQLNKLRYKNGKGDPKGFVAFLDDKNIPRGVLPRYRGNRLHVLFHIGGKVIEYYDDFLALLNSLTPCGGLRNAVIQDITQATAKQELQILGLLGKFLTGPWMKTFYTSTENQINHVDGITVVKEVIVAIKKAIENPDCMLTSGNDFFNKPFEDDRSLTKLRELPVGPNYKIMMTSSLEAIVQVLEKQYSKYFGIDITEKLQEETASARSHNMDAEEIMGMFSSSQQKSRNATMCYLSCRMRACKNKTVKYLDSLEEMEWENLVQKAIKYGRLQRNKRKKKQHELRAEVIKRQKLNEHTRDTKERKRVEKKLKETDLDIDSLRKDFPDLDYTHIDDLSDILNGQAVGKKACHVWFEEKLVVYNAKVEKLRRNNIYKIAYWLKDEDYDDSTDYDIPKHQLAADLLYGDFVFC